MKTILIALALLLLGLSGYPAPAQFNGCPAGFCGSYAGAPPPPTCASVNYQGPGDILAWKAYYGLDAYSAATCGNKVANVCNSTGGVDVGCADMVSSTSTGQLVPATISSITCPGANCTVKIWYDQSGSLSCTSAACDVTQATVSNRPLLPATCTGAVTTCLSWTTTAQILTKSTSLTQAQPVTLSGVQYIPVETTFPNMISCDQGGLGAVLYWTNTSQYSAYAGTAAGESPTGYLATWAAVQALLNNTGTNAWYINGIPNSSTANPGADGCLAADSIQIGAGLSATWYQREVGVIAGALSGTQQSNLNANMRARGGF